MGCFHSCMRPAASDKNPPISEFANRPRRFNPDGMSTDPFAPEGTQYVRGYSNNGLLMAYQ